ncbi:VCBS domain-containing protein [Bradyrhizobium sp. HKCCYLRH3099]|uniref:Npun_F0296 family exosortase-dependent surface protein n=1 Tax=unclassified Bradyrhizobium TaxID=2631580 RepID=UPI003EB74C32
MNYAGKSDAALFSDGLGTPAHAPVRLDVPPAHAPADAIVVPDAHFLFSADFKRSGVDLILSSDGRDLVLPDYFKGEKRAPLASPDGAHLTGDLVNALSGAVQVSQAGAAAAGGKVIGHVTKLVGTATVIRNGVSILLHNGDNVEKGDIVQSGSNSTLGITFIDGTVFGLSSNARMVLNEMVYDPNGSNNSSLISLVAGTISFVAGETAKHGDMKVDTPVATMGIRGTAVLVEIDFNVPGQGGLPDAKFQVLVEPDGRTGSYVLFDKTTLQPIAVVNQAGQQIQISNGVVNQSAVPLSPDIQKLINDVFSLKFTDNTNPKSNTHFTDIGVLQPLAPLTLPNGTSATPIIKLTDTTTPTTPSSTTSEQPSHLPGAPEVRILDSNGKLTTSFGLVERAGQTGNTTDFDTVLSRVNFLDVNAIDKPTVSVSFKSYAYKSADQADVTGSLNALQVQDVMATAVKITVVPDPTNKNFGSATLTYSVPDKSFDFLAAGETLTLTYVVRVDNNFAPSNEYTEVPITITVTGTNDKPEIVASVPTVAFEGGTSVPGGPLTSDDPTSGTLTFKDVDLTDTHTVSAKLSSAVLEGGGSIPPAPLALFEQALTASLALDSTGSGTGKINWTLADLPVYVADFIPAGKTLTLTYTVTLKDSQGATSTQTVTVTITGTDDPAVVWIATTQPDGQSGAQVMLWSDGANWATGLAPTAADDVIIITDQLHGLTPAFPVTIDSAAFAKSVSLNDFGGGAVPQLDNHSTLTISGALTAKADSRIYNFSDAILSVGGSAQLLDQSELHNSGTVLLAGGGVFGASAIISNVGTIELSAGTLVVHADVENAGEDRSGLIQVDLGATLTLDGGSIDGGTILIQGVPVIQNIGTLQDGEESPEQPGGVLQLTGGAEIRGGELDNFGTVDVSGTGNTLSNESVTNVGLIDIKADGELTLDGGTSIDNAGGSITVEDAATLTLTHASITAGVITNESSGTIALAGHGALIGGIVDNSGVIAVSGSGNALDDETITNANAAAITIALSGALSLSGTTIAGGAITSAGTISVDGDSVIDGSAVQGGSVLIGDSVGQFAEGSVVLTLEGGAVVTSVDVTIGEGATLEVASAAGATLVDVSVDSSGIVQVDEGALLLIEDSTITGGDLVNRGTVHVETEAASTFDNVTIDNAGGVIIIDEAGDTPVPSTLVLDGGTSLTGGTLEVQIAGTLEIAGHDVTLSGVQVENAGVFTVDLDAILALVDTKVSGDGELHVYGTITASGVSGLSGTIYNEGTIEIVAGNFEITGNVEGSGQIKVDAGATLKVDGHVDQTIDFSSEGSSELVVDDAGLSAKIAGLSVGDKIDLSTIAWSATTTASYDAETGVLTVTDGQGHSIDLTLVGDYSNAHFAGSTDGHGGTLITLTAEDAAPVIADPDQAGSIAETAEQTGSSAPHTATGTIHFTDVDLTDRPAASILADSQQVKWTAADHQTDLSNQLTSTQIAALEQALQLSHGANTNNGAVDWTYAIADGALDFLGAGETVMVTTKVTVDDHQGGTAISTVVVTITGTNDQPVITSDVQAAEISERADTSGSKLRDTATGTITFTDADVTDTHAVKVTGVAVEGAHDGLPSDSSVLLSWLSLGPLTDSGSGGTGSQSWTFSAKDKGFDYLGVDQQVTLTYTVEIADGRGGVVDVPITITVNGANDAPVIVAETNPPVQTVILAERAIELASSATANTAGMATETFDHNSWDFEGEGRGHDGFYSQALHATFTASGAAGIVQGSSSVLSAPYMDGGRDQTKYLTIGANAHETITFDSIKNSFGLYWGSVDAYNSISFYSNNKLVAFYTGSDVAPLIANGGQTSSASNGYVEFLGLTPFNKVVLASSQNAFELDNVSAGYIPDQPVKLSSDMSGTLTVRDKDIGDTLTASVLGQGVVKYNGSSNLPENVHVDALASAAAITFDSATSDGHKEVLHWTYHPDAVNLDFLKPGDTLTVTYQAVVSDGHDTSATKPLTITLAGDGASTINGTGQDDNFVNVGGGVTIFGKGGNDTFVFNPHFGSATIGDLNLNKDIVEIDHSLFASVQAMVDAAQSANGGQDTVITDAAHDTLTLKGVTLDQFKAHHDGFHLV